MKRTQILRIFLCVAALSWAAAMHARRQDYASPDGRVGMTVTSAGDRVASFGFSLKGEAVLTLSGYGVHTPDGGGRGLRLTGVSQPRRISESYEMKVGKRLQCANEANEYVFHFSDSLGRKQDMVIRLYDDGVAFRYEMDGLRNTPVSGEATAYRIGEGTRRWMQKWTEPYEEFFPLTTTGSGDNRHWGYPALIQAGDDAWALITEAGIERCHSASSLYNDRSATEYRVVPDVNALSHTGHWQSPWRVIIIGDRQTLVASTLVTDVSAPCRMADTGWIVPGGVSWIYWAYNHGSNDYGIVTQYIDMAAALGLPYVLIDAEWDEMGNGGTVEDALRYAKERGVRTLLWYNSSTAWTKAGGAPGPHERLNDPESREREFAWLERSGVAGVKIDFFAGDRQATMEYCMDLLECAARHHLMVNFHGATIPRGWQRTYPNLMTTEAVYGAEWYNNLPVLTDRAAAHNATLPFTRGVIGSMDYTPCTFSDSQHPHITTHAHELALPVLFESALLHWADRPESYLAQPAEVRRFIGSLPTAWDETRLLAGYPGEYVVMARRKGTTWYVAAINGKDTEQTISFDASGLPEGRITLFADSGEKDTPWSISTYNGLVPSEIRCRPRGGAVLVVE